MDVVVDVVRVPLKAHRQDFYTCAARIRSSLCLSPLVYLVVHSVLPFSANRASVLQFPFPKVLSVIIPERIKLGNSTASNQLQNPFA